MLNLSNSQFIQKILEKIEHFRSGEFDRLFKQAFGKNPRDFKKLIYLIYDIQYENFPLRKKIEKSNFNKLKMIIINDVYQLGLDIPKLMLILIKKIPQIQQIEFPQYNFLKINLAKYTRKLELEYDFQYAFTKNKITAVICDYFNLNGVYQQYITNPFRNQNTEYLLISLLQGYAPDREQILKDFQRIKNKQARLARLRLKQIFQQHGILYHYEFTFPISIYI